MPVLPQPIQTQKPRRASEASCESLQDTNSPDGTAKQDTSLNDIIQDNLSQLLSDVENLSSGVAGLSSHLHRLTNNFAMVWDEQKTLAVENSILRQELTAARDQQHQQAHEGHQGYESENVLARTSFNSACSSSAPPSVAAHGTRASLTSADSSAKSGVGHQVSFNPARELDFYIKQSLNLKPTQLRSIPSDAIMAMTSTEKSRMQGSTSDGRKSVRGASTTSGSDMLRVSSDIRTNPSILSRQKMSWRNDGTMVECHPVWLELCEVRPSHLSAGTSNYPSTTRDMETHSVYKLRPSTAFSLSSRTSIRIAFGNILDPRWIIMHPYSWTRFAWDLSAAIFLFYDLIVVPLRVFRLPDSGFLQTMAWVTVTFWTLDVAASFLTGVHEDGVVVMRPSKIAEHYRRGWLFFDVIVLAADWAFVVATQDEKWDFHDGKSLMSLVRLLRLLKTHLILSRALEYLQTELSRVLVDLAKFVVFIVFANHIIACMWFQLGMWGQDLATFDDTWVAKSGNIDRTTAYLYATSLHWSMTQFTPASMEVYPANTIERIFTVAVVLFALITFSSLVSSITNATTQLRNLNKERLAQYSTLRRFLNEREVKADLVCDIWGHVECAWKESQTRIHEKQVPMLDLLPRSLRSDLQHQVFSPVLNAHPFFHHFIENHPIAIRRVYSATLSEESLSLGQELFNAGEPALHMFFIAVGRLDYDSAGLELITKSARGSLMQQFEGVNVEKGSWISELSLWAARWDHRGRLTAKSQSEILSINAAAFHRLLRKELSYIYGVARYAKGVIEKACMCISCTEQGLTDVWGDFDELVDVAMEAFSDDPSYISEESPENADGARVTGSQEVRKTGSVGSQRSSWAQADTLRNFMSTMSFNHMKSALSRYSSFSSRWSSSQRASGQSG